MKTSSLEAVVIQLLNQAGKKYVREKQFSDCYNGLYRFDFYSPTENWCLEINGRQHYVYTKNFYKSRADFTKAQERDRRKIAYCLAHNIDIYIIPYWEIDNLLSVGDLFQYKFKATSKFHNDEVWSHQKP